MPTGTGRTSTTGTRTPSGRSPLPAAGLAALVSRGLRLPPARHPDLDQAPPDCGSSGSPLAPQERLGSKARPGRHDHRARLVESEIQRTEDPPGRLEWEGRNLPEGAVRLRNQAVRCKKSSPGKREKAESKATRRHPDFAAKAAR